jgi:hypothetical protein
LVNDQVNETLGTTVELEIMSEATDFNKHILSILVCGGSCDVKTLNQTSFHMQRMVRVEIEILTSVGGFPVDFGVVSFRMTKTSERQSYCLTLFP